MWTYLTFVFMNALDPAQVSAPWAQLVHHTSDPGIQPLARVLHITVHSEWELTKDRSYQCTETDWKLGSHLRANLHPNSLWVRMKSGL